MLAVASEGERAVLRELERVLESPGFIRNERISRFLRFLVERHLAGKDHELKESVLGTEVFGRSPDYDPKRDPIVRTEAGRLRSRLIEYYAREGRDDALGHRFAEGRLCARIPPTRGAPHEGRRPKGACPPPGPQLCRTGNRVSRIESLLRCSST